MSPRTAMWLALHDLPPLLIDSTDEGISQLHIRSLTPVPFLVFIPFLFQPLVFPNKPFGEGDNLPYRELSRTWKAEWERGTSGDSRRRPGRQQIGLPKFC